jgi:putative MATE family efflux protein
MTKNKTSYTEGNVTKTLIYHSIPMLFGVGAAIAFNFVDTIFIARLGTLELAAITFTFPIVFLIIGVAMGMGMGASAVISRAYGEQNYDKVKKLTTDGIVISFLSALVFVIIGLVFFEEIFILMGANPELLPYIKEFMGVWYPGIVFITIPMVGNAAIRAIGDTKIPSLVMMIAVAINLILDPIFIFGWGFIPKMGLTGAATATLFGRFVSLVICLYFLIKKYDMIDLNIKNLFKIKDSFKEIMYVGGPSSITNILVPLGMAIVIGLISKYGESAVAAMGAASRVEMVTMTVFMALGSVLGPFIGQNWGAKKPERILDALKKSYLFSFIWGGLMLIVFYIFKEDIAIFIKDDIEVVKFMIIYLSITPISIAFLGGLMIISTALNVLKKPITASVLTILQMFVIFIPLAYLLSSNLGFEGIFWASVTSSIIVFFIAYFILKKHLKMIL